MTDIDRAIDIPAARAAFDRLAPSYDALAAGEIFRLLRERTHRVLDRTFPAGCRVIEVGCGTGLDTAFLAGRGVHVLACDPAEGMVSCTTRRLARHGLAGRATALACGLDELVCYLDGLDDSPAFDGLVSNFGALNCVESLAPLAALVARHIRPGGSLVLGLMGRSCAWEALYFVCTFRPRLAARRRGERPVAVRVAGTFVPTFYHSADEVVRALGAQVTLSSRSGIGVLVPPPYLEPRWQGLPVSLRRLCATADRILSPWPPFNRFGDHMLLGFTKTRACQ